MLGYKIIARIRLSLITIVSLIKIDLIFFIPNNHIIYLHYVLNRFQVIT